MMIDVFSISCCQIERELILSSDKASSKIPLMHESRTPSGIRRTGGIPLLSRQPASIAPDHPPKQAHAWVSLRSQHHNNNNTLTVVLRRSHSCFATIFAKPIHQTDDFDSIESNQIESDRIESN